MVTGLTDDEKALGYKVVGKEDRLFTEEMVVKILEGRGADLHEEARTASEEEATSDATG